MNDTYLPKCLNNNNIIFEKNGICKKCVFYCKFSNLSLYKKYNKRGQ
jgi:hypothetical protein